MVQIDITLSAAVGATLASAARVQLRSQKSLWGNEYLRAALAFSGFFLIPTILFFLCSWPSWDTMYWFDRDSLPGWFVAATAATCLLFAALGFVLAHALVLRGREKLAAVLPALLLLPAGVVLALFPHHLLHVGTRASFAAGAPVNFFQSGPLWASVSVIPAALLLPLAAVAWRWAQPALAELRAQRTAKRAA
ncbi:MAG: hypothetical protein ACYDCL_17720 [Myxococcales bacterium]